jgi:hypothetical protein
MIPGYLFLKYPCNGHISSRVLKYMGRNCGRKVAWILLSILWLSLAGPVQGAAESPEIRTVSSGLKPGLAVIYIEKNFRNIDQVPTGEAAFHAGHQGKAVLMLNHQSDKKGVVFDSGRSQGVAMVMDGFLHLGKKGTYLWQALANDGIRMFINGRLIFEDPSVHKDRLTPVGTLQVMQPGWYPVSITYFQRKGTASLKLYWQPAAASEFTLVPADVYWHRQSD